MARRLLVVATLVPAIAFGPGGVMPSAVADSDGVPDGIESEICGRSAVRNLIALAGSLAGRCVSNADYAPPRMLLDGDGDFLPDAAEPFICAVQSQNTSADGWCGNPDGSDDSDYTLPLGDDEEPPPPPRDHTQTGDHVMQNGPGTIYVTAPDGQTFYGENRTTSGTTTAVIPAGVVANGTWYVQSNVTCCGGRPQYFWSIAGFTAGTGFQCTEGQSLDFWIDYDNRTWIPDRCHW